MRKTAASNENEPTTFLDEFDIEEWWDVCRRLRPDIPRETFEEMWAEFIADKQRRQLN
jgi:hypothetical protein